MFDARWGDDLRDRDDNSRDLSRGSRGGSDPRDRERVDPRDVFMEHVGLPRGLEREHVHHHGHDYTLRGSETRTLTTVGAFRAVPASDLRDSFDQPLDPRHGELWHLRDSGLVQTVRLDRDHSVVTLTKEGRDLLESRRLDDDSRNRQAYAGVPKPRELKHDAELYRAYTEEAERLRDEGANIHRIVIENDLKREYQEFLQERNRYREDTDGRPNRDPLEIQDWAREHDLPCDDRGHVQFPDVRIEYDIDGREHTLDVEVMTPHFPDRLPIGIHLSGRGVLVYVVLDPTLNDFRLFLERHSAVLRALPAWTVRVVVPPQFSDPLVNPPDPARFCFLETISSKRAVARMVAAAHGNKEIARRFNVSEETIKHHLAGV